MEAVELKDFYRKKKVFLTGHTGFKGSWLCLLLDQLGAKISGYALDPPTEPSLYRLLDVDSLCRSAIADVRDAERLKQEMSLFQPDIVFHLAAQPLVRESYRIPVETYATNVMGTVNLLEAVRQTPSVRAVVVVTTDKVYENREWCWGYREHEAVGGYDPYSSSKACAELITSAYRRSFFSSPQAEQRVAVATARAGNVIGGGDWAFDRLLPDCIRALQDGAEIEIRNPHSVRPWQHVFESLNGYLLLAEKLYSGAAGFADAWNFGPDAGDEWPVEKVVATLCRYWGNGAKYSVADLQPQPHEAHYLRLDSAKAKSVLGWRPKWELEKSLQRVVDWHRAWQNGVDMGGLCRQQLQEYFELLGD